MRKLLLGIGVGSIAGFTSGLLVISVGFRLALQGRRQGRAPR